MSGYALYDYDIQRTEGELLTLIETLGFAEKQEQAIKSQLRRIIHQLYGQPQIGGDFLNDALRKTRDAGIGWGGLPTVVGI